MRKVFMVVVLIVVTGLLFGAITFSDSMLKAAKAGNAEAQYNLAVCYQNGYGVKADIDEALKWYKSAAEQGLVAAQYALGLYYKNGIKALNPPSGQTKEEQTSNFKETKVNYSEAVKWFRLAANQEDAAAQFNLGECYFYGKGVEKSVKEALRLYLQAADKNYAEAENRIGQCYQLGEGVIQDYSEAVKWYTLATKHGCYTAAANMAQMYFSDYAVIDRNRESYFWWLIAAANDVKGAQTNRDNVGQLLCKAEKDVLVVKATKWMQETDR